MSAYDDLGVHIETLSNGAYWIVTDENYEREFFSARLDAHERANERSKNADGVIEVIYVEQRIMGLYQKGQRLV